MIMRTTKKAKWGPQLPSSARAPSQEPIPLPPGDAAICKAWDTLRNAIGRVLTAQPHSMTEASCEMEAASKEMGRIIQDSMLAKAKERTEG